MDSDSDNEILDDLAEEFIARYRQGERLPLSEFIARHPELADEIRDLFPTLAVMEEARLAAAQSGDHHAKLEPVKVPTSIGEYRILREVGRGGMGIVYEALQESLGRHVALKILPPHGLLDARLLHRFQREARAAARLHHTNIVPVFGVGVHEGLNYYAMQFIRGQGLDQVLNELKVTRNVSKTSSRLRQDGPATITQSSGVTFHGIDRSSSLPDSGYAYWLGIARVGAQVADALAYAHSQGVIHRDIKPANLLLDNEGTVWVTDFGLAKDTPADRNPKGDDQNDLTHTGDIVGTLRYMAPELLRGHSDARSDIYSLGATLFELLTLRAAFDESDRNVFMRRLLHEEPTRPRCIDAAIPVDLETIVLKAMAKEPQDRYRNADELAEDLRRFMTDRPIRARRVSPWERAWRVCRRNPLITSLSLAVVLLIALLAVGLQVASWIRLERDRAIASADRAQSAEKQAQESLHRALDAEKDASIRAHLTQAIVQRKRDLPGRRLRGIEQIEQALALTPADNMRHELRNELVASLALTDAVHEQSWDSPHGSFAVDPQFKHYARATRDGIVSIRRVADDQEVRRLLRAPSPDSRGALKFSPDGNYLASFTFDQHVMVWQMSDGSQVLDDEGCCWEFSFDFTPDSRAIVLGHDQEMLVYDLKEFAIQARWPIEFAPWNVACGPSDDLVAITPEGDDSSRKLQVYRWSTHKLIAQHVAPKWVFDIAWHPTGKALAYGCGDTNIYIWNIADAQPHRKLSGSLARGIRVAFSHDGQMLASSSWGHEFYLWEPYTGEMLCASQSPMLCLQFSPDDARLALFQDGPQVGTYRIIQSDVFRYFVRGGNRAEGNGLLKAAFSLDGKLLTISTEKGLSICEYPSGHERAFAPIGQVAHLCRDNAGNLLTSSGSLKRWPLGLRGTDAGHYILGSPEQLPYQAHSEFGISRDGRTMIIANYDGAFVIHSDRPDRPVVLSPHEDCRYVALSHDGKLAATASHHGSKVKVWDCLTGSLQATLPIESSSLVMFSPDGRWLATPVGARNLWKVGSWEPGPDLGGLVAGFSEDSRMVAVDDLAGSVHLIDPDTAWQYVRLEHPKRYSADRYYFTPSGHEVVAVSTMQPSGFAWSLDRIRQHLAARGLDWDLPTLPSRAIEDRSIPIEVELR